MSARWPTRDGLAASARTARGLLAVPPDAACAYPLHDGDEKATAAALTAAGVGGGDRVAVALAEPAGALWASAASRVAAAAASLGPRGRMRLQHALRELGATTLVITPTGAMDLLARLHLEFLLDPLDLGLRHIVVTGEIASRHTLRHLAAEFDARVTEVYADPFGGGALAWRTDQSAPLTPIEADTLGLAALAADEPLPGPPYPAGVLGELVVAARGRHGLGDAVLRTGQVGRPGEGGGLPAPEHTVGEHLLVRGVWLSLPRIERALARIDGIATWELSVDRRGTLDAAALTVTFGRPGLVGNPMWRARVREAVKALTPVSIEVAVAEEVMAESRPGTVTDLRGHHLGRDRTAIAP
ncbi:phenylacetate-CoA ligase [Thermocatellispora tengchongensis]|uniref:Phenylacetate-CoA ligase n=1 Tax=Thermocatellispora tengchongensis TaxID=1073253 RepID=A0A840P2L1_9ACTN|nr:hypothetical protein [Thermocatellispora tengchongensis]MBB5133219.1 phenylacetate-CoA ligase [Thermocatellispora tengchongensis]